MFLINAISEGEGEGEGEGEEREKARERERVHNVDPIVVHFLTKQNYENLP